MGILFSSADPSAVEECNEKRDDWAPYRAVRQGSSSSEENEEDYSDPASWRLQKTSFWARRGDGRHKLPSSEPQFEETISPSENIKKQHHNTASSQPIVGEFRPRKETQMTFDEHFAMVSEQHAARNRRMSREQIQRRLSRGRNDGHIRVVRQNRERLQQEQGSRVRSRRYTEPANDRSAPQAEPTNHRSWHRKADEADSREATGFMRAVNGEGGVYRL